MIRLEKRFPSCGTEKSPSSLFCVDIHPNQPVFIVGCIDGNLYLWPTEFSADNNLPVATLVRHTGAVLSVRWNLNGSLLATGSDDRLVVVWSCSPALQIVATKILNCHSSDVTDVYWSENFLISSGMDGCVAVHDSRLGYQQIAKVQLPGAIKGMAVDALGRWVACQGEESLFVLRTSDWGKERVIRGTGLLAGSFFARPGWSADGEFLVSPGGVQPGGSAFAWCYDRENWSRVFALVGHVGAIECCSFSQVRYERKEEPSAAYLLAVGCKDGTVSIWSTAQPSTPLLVLWQIFTHSVMQIIWHPSGSHLIAVSYDGTALKIVLSDYFSTGGWMLHRAAVGGAGNYRDARGSLHAGYTQSLTELQLGIAATGEATTSAAIQSPPPLVKTVAFTSGSARDLSVDVATRIAAQSESLTHHGRRRITPLTIAQPATATSEGAIRIDRLLASGIPAIPQPHEPFPALSPMVCSKTATAEVQSSNSRLHASQSNGGFIELRRSSLVLWRRSPVAELATALFAARCSDHFLAICTDRLALLVWSLETGCRIFPTLFLPSAAHLLQFLPSDRLVAITTDRTVFMWSLSERRLCWIAKGAPLQASVTSVKAEPSDSLRISLVNGSHLFYSPSETLWLEQEPSAKHAQNSIFARSAKQTGDQNRWLDQVASLTADQLLSASLDHLEYLMAAATYEATADSRSPALWLSLCQVYLRFVVNAGSEENRIRQVLQSMLLLSGRFPGQLPHSACLHLFAPHLPSIPPATRQLICEYLEQHQSQNLCSEDEAK